MGSHCWYLAKEVIVEEGTAFLASSLLKLLALSTTIEMISSAQHASWGIIRCATASLDREAFA